MKFPLLRTMPAEELSARIDAECRGGSAIVSSIAPIHEASAGSLTFWQGDHRYDGSVGGGACIIARSPELVPAAVGTAWLICGNPRLAFIRLLDWMARERFLPEPGPGRIDDAAEVHPTAVVDSGATVGANCRIGPQAHLSGCCELADGVSVGAGSLLGHSGFGYERDANGVPVKFPHLGRVVIEADCVVGCATTIARGNLTDTRIGRNAKIDDGVYIAHNCDIGNETLVAGRAVICGGVSVGDGCWIGAGSTIRQGVQIGERATVGLGATVLNSVPADSTVVGNPARILGN